MADGDPEPGRPHQKAVEVVEKVGPFLRPEGKAKAEKIIMGAMTKIHQGPLPAPEDLAAYNTILPGSAERILSMAEKNLDHRQELETRWQRAEIRQAARGQWLAILALLAMLGVIAFAILRGEPWIAGILGGATLVSIVSMFLAAQHRRRPPPPAPTKKNQPARRRR